MPKLKKPMVYKEEDGTKYKISYSEQLQLRNLKATKQQVKWEKMNFYAKIILICVLGLLTISMLYLFYQLDRINFFTGILYR